MAYRASSQRCCILSSKNYQKAYTPSGGTITLQGERVPGSVRLIVCDTGKGIAPEDLPSIFDRFWRGDAIRSRTEGAGGGLGLAIARQLVLAHGGRIEVESQPGLRSNVYGPAPGRRWRSIDWSGAPTTTVEPSGSTQCH